MIDQNDASYLFFDLWAEKNLKVYKPGSRCGDWNNLENPWELHIVPWEKKSYLANLAKEVDENRFVIVNKFRQCGGSTFIVGYGLWDAIWHNDRRIMFISKTDREAMALNRIARTMLEHLPEQPILGNIKPTRITDHNIEFDNGSSIWFHAPIAACAKAATHLFIDEAAFISDMGQHWKSMYPVISTGGKCTVISTPCGNSGWFYETFTRENSFKKIRLNWRDEEKYNNLEWETQMVKNLGEYGFLQEVAGMFLGAKCRLGISSRGIDDDLQQKIKIIEDLKKQIDQQIDNLHIETPRSDNTETLLKEFGW